MPMVSDDIGHRLKRFIDQKGFHSVSSAAKACGLSRTQLWDIIHGRKSPTLETLERIVTALGGTMTELFSDED
jgi:transcriptional regulator with XRE-family HTH domain